MESAFRTDGARRTLLRDQEHAPARRRTHRAPEVDSGRCAPSRRARPASPAVAGAWRDRRVLWRSPSSPGQQPAQLQRGARAHTLGAAAAPLEPGRSPERPGARPVGRGQIAAQACARFRCDGHGRAWLTLATAPNGSHLIPRPRVDRLQLETQGTYTSGGLGARGPCAATDDQADVRIQVCPTDASSGAPTQGSFEVGGEAARGARQVTRDGAGARTRWQRRGRDSLSVGKPELSGLMKILRTARTRRS